MNIKRKLERKPFFRNDLIYFAPAFIWGIFISVATLLPGSKVPRVFLWLNDKWIHAFIYFLTAALLYLGCIRYNFKNSISRAALSFIIVGCIAYGGVLELVQNYFISQRSGEWFDFFANSSGSVICVLLLYLVHGKKA